MSDLDRRAYHHSLNVDMDIEEDEAQQARTNRELDVLSELIECLEEMTTAFGDYRAMGDDDHSILRRARRLLCYIETGEES